MEFGLDEHTYYFVRCNIYRLSSDPTFLVSSYFSDFLHIIPAVSKSCESVTVKCVQYLYDYKGQYFYIISQFGSQYELIF